MARNYKNLQIFNLAYDIAILIYKITNFFPEHEIRGLTNQLRRSAISMPSNIAEGSTRRSEKEFLQFLSYAYGSAKEISVQLRIAKDIGYIKNLKVDYVKNSSLNNESYDNWNQYLILLNMLDEFQARIYKLMRHLEKDTLYTFYQEFKTDINKIIT